MVLTPTSGPPSTAAAGRITGLPKAAGVLNFGKQHSFQPDTSHLQFQSTRLNHETKHHKPMKKILNFRIFFAAMLVFAPLVSKAATFFTDNFSNGSTTNGPSLPGGTAAASFTSYDIASTKNTIPGT